MKDRLLIRSLLVIGLFGSVIVAGFTSPKVPVKKAPVKRYTAEQVGKTDYRNFYGVGNRGNAHENLLYARQMGYDLVFYQPGMEKDPLSKGMGFYLEDPEYSVYDRVIFSKRKYSAGKIDFYENYCVLKDSTRSFPDNLAKGWIWRPNTDNFTVILDFQQQKVVSWAVSNITKFIENIEKINPDFHFAGYAWDEPRPSGDFYDMAPTFRSVTLANWTGGDHGAIRNGASHDFNTFTDGHMAFYKQLYKAARAKNPDAHFMGEPFSIYEGWIKQMQDRPEAKEVTPDILSQEGPGTQFVDDKRIINSGLVKKQNIFSTTSSIFDEKSNRITAAKAAMNGAGFAWYGCFGSAGNMPNYQNVTEVPQRLLLIRMLTNWEDRNGTQLSQRAWDGTIYKSPTAFVSPDVISILQPGTKKLFFVILDEKGVVTIPGGQQISSISATNNLFIESGNGASDVTVQGNTILPSGTNSFGKGYIVKLK